MCDFLDRGSGSCDQIPLIPICPNRLRRFESAGGRSQLALPVQGGAYDRADIGMPRPPAKLLLQAGGIGDQHCGVTGAARHFPRRKGLSTDTLYCTNDFVDAQPAAITTIVD